VIFNLYVFDLFSEFRFLCIGRLNVLTVHSILYILLSSLYNFILTNYDIYLYKFIVYVYLYFSIILYLNNIRSWFISSFHEYQNIFHFYVSSAFYIFLSYISYDLLYTYKYICTYTLVAHIPISNSTCVPNIYTSTGIHIYILV
jgi:hypothetical protein